jgi:hypothetical protein
MKNDIEHTVERKDGKTVLRVGEFVFKWSTADDADLEQEYIDEYLDMQRRELFYNSQSFIDEFNKHLETAILATRGGNSAAGTIADALLSLYNGNHYKANLSGWYNLDSTNRAALLFVLEHQTANNRKPIDLYLPQYAADFDRMRKERSSDD